MSNNNKIRVEQLDTGSLVNFINSGSQLGSFVSPTVFTLTGYFAVNTVSDLRNISIGGLANNTIVFVKSYYGDSIGKGGGTFIWNLGNTSPDDSGRYLAPTVGSASGRWIRLINTEVNAYMWGAKGDAITDDTVAMQAAFDAMNGSTFGMHLDDGVYKISSPLIISAPFSLIGNGGFTILSGASGYRGDLIQTTNYAIHSSGLMTANTGSPYYTGACFDEGFIIRNMQFFGHVLEVPTAGDFFETDITGSFLSIFQPRGASSIEQIFGIAMMHGVRCVGNSTLHLQSFSPHESTEGGAYFCPAIVDGSGAPGIIGQAILDTLSCDNRNMAHMTGASIVKVVSGAGFSVHLNNVKAEGHWGSGLVCYITDSVSTTSGSPNAFISVEGGTVNRGIVAAATGTTGNCALVRIYGASGYNSAVPTVFIHDINLYNMEYLIEDFAIPAHTGSSLLSGTGIGTNPFRLYPDSTYGLQQGEARLPITYNAQRKTLGTTGVDYFNSVRRRVERKSYQITKFTPLQTGWYRIAGNSHANSFGGRFHIFETSSTGLVNLSFNSLFKSTTGNIKIYTALTGFITGQRISGVRGGWSTSGNYGFIDIAIRQAFNSGGIGTGDFPRDFFIGILYEPDGHEIYNNDYTPLTDPIFVTGFQGPNNYLIQKTLDSSLSGDIVI